MKAPFERSALTDWMTHANVTKEEVGQVLADPWAIEVSRSSGCPIAFGVTGAGRYLAVIFEEIDPDTAFPITAYDVPV